MGLVSLKNDISDLSNAVLFRSDQIRSYHTSINASSPSSHLLQSDQLPLTRQLPQQRKVVRAEA